MRRNSPRIIRRTRRWPYLVGAGIVVCGLLGLYVVRADREEPASLSGDSTPARLDTAPTTLAPTGTLDGQPSGSVPGRELTSQTGTVYLDGWSMKSLAGKTVTIADAEGRSTPLRFSAVPLAQIRKLASDSPRIVEDALSHLVTPQANVVCSSGGCKSTAGDVDLGLLADLASVPSLGKMYAAWSVREGLYQAPVTLSGATPYTVTIAGQIGQVIGDSRTDPVVTGDNGKKAVAGSAEGYGVGTWLLSHAYGRTFLTNPTWGDASPSQQQWSKLPALGSTIPDATLEQIDAAAGSLPFISGVGSVSAGPTLGRLTASQMTFVSSPVTGCSYLGLCVPGQVDVSVTTEYHATTPVCANGGSDKFVAVADNVVASFTLPHLTFVPGAEGKGYEGGTTAGWKSRTPLATGSQRVRYVAVRIYSLDGQLLGLAGGRGLTTDRPTFSLDSLPDFFDDTFAAC